MQIIRNEHVTAGNGLITLYLILQFYSLYSSLNVLKYKLLPIVSGRGFYVRNSYLRLVRGYIQNGGRGGTGIPPPPLPEILKLSMIIIVLSQVLRTILSQIPSEAI